MTKFEDTVVKAKGALPDVTPTPPGFKTQSTAHDLKARLNWGEPGLTIVDVRDRDAFNDEHITGALPLPVDDLGQAAQLRLLKGRDIYVYGSDDQQTATAASAIRQAGFDRVSELKGGITAWKEIDGAVDGSTVIEVPPPGAYNVLSRLKEHAEVKAKERAMER